MTDSGKNRNQYRDELGRKPLTRVVSSAYAYVVIAWLVKVMNPNAWPFVTSH